MLSWYISHLRRHSAAFAVTSTYSLPLPSVSRKPGSPGYTGRPSTAGRASTPSCHRPTRACPASRRAGGEGDPGSCDSEPDAPPTGVLLVGGPPLRSLPWAGSACARWASAARQCFSTPTTAAFSCEVLLSFDRRLRRLLFVSLVVRAALFFYVAVVMMAAFLAHLRPCGAAGSPSSLCELSSRRAGLVLAPPGGDRGLPRNTPSAPLRTMSA